jgi:uncharacterized cupin superfamily protein
MPRLISAPAEVAAAGEPPKIIREYVGRANTETAAVSIAHMSSPSGWKEPGQRPAFDEYSVVLRGALHVATEDGRVLEVTSGQAVMASAGEWVQYSTPGPEGADYIAVCLPAFSPDTVNREAS